MGDQTSRPRSNAGCLFAVGHVGLVVCGLALLGAIGTGARDERLAAIIAAGAIVGAFYSTVIIALGMVCRRLDRL